MLSTTFNPYTWDFTRDRVHSDVLSLQIKDDKGNIINMSNLTSDISLELPLHPDNHTWVLENFANPTSLGYHAIHVPYEETFMKIEIKPQTPKAQYTIYFRYDQRPTTEVYDLNRKLFSNCILGHDAKEYDCATEVVHFVARKSGTYFIGLLGEKIYGHKRTDREKRSCFGRHRHKRSCVEVKDPPPTPPSYKNVTVTPEYHPLTDANYTLRARLGSCVYWSSEQKKWTTDGCKVRRRFKLSLNTNVNTNKHIF